MTYIHTDKDCRTVLNLNIFRVSEKLPLLKLRYKINLDGYFSVHVSDLLPTLLKK